MFLLRYILIVLSISLFCCKNDIVKVKDGNGTIIEEYTVDKDKKKHGLYTAYNDKGIISETAEYVNGQLHGERKIYDADGNLEIVESYKDNVTDGPYSVLYPDGQVKFETTYSAGVMNSKAKSYTAAGTLKEEVTFVNNEENGPFKEYYDNGNIEWEGTYLNGDNEFGLLKHYDESGELIRKMMCDSMAICRTIWTKADGDITPKF
jgi:antitoxin component YwqK of YwqJK toxin-antitoxin module